MNDHFDKEGPLAAIDHLKEEITDACNAQDSNFLSVLTGLKVITEQEKEDAYCDEEYDGVLEKLKAKIKDDPSFFAKFCTTIQEKPDLKDLAARIVGINSKIQTGQLTVPCISDGENGQQSGLKYERDVGRSSYRLKVDDQLKKLRKQLNVLQEIPSESEELKASKLMMTKNAMKTFIKTSLDMGGDAQSIYDILKNLHEKDADIIIDGEVYQWCIEELEKQNELRNPQSPNIRREESQQLSEVCLNKEIVQNSIFACYVLGNAEMDLDIEHLAFPHSLCEVNRSEYLKLRIKEQKNTQQKEDFLESFSSTSTDSTFDGAYRLLSSTGGNSLYLRSTDTTSVISKPQQFSEATASDGTTVHQYLIAKGAVKPNGHVIYYIAFSSHQSLKEWSDGHTSFEDGFMKQEQHLPIQFILEKLWEGASIVLTGFSFGGILAHLCAFRLWNLSQGICPELLERNLLCVTFGQPILSLSRMASITNKAANKARFHAIYINGDIIPRMMRYLDPSYTKLSDSSLPEKFRKQNKPDEIFQNHLSTSIMRQLLVLQECRSEKHSHMQRAVHDLGRHIRQKIDEKFDGHRASERRKHRNSDGPGSSMDAIQDLRSILKPLKQKGSSVMPSYVTQLKVGTRDLCKADDMEFPAIEEIEEDMFSKHNTDEYLQVITRDYVKGFEFEEAFTLVSGGFAKPMVKRLEIHHFSHHDTAAFSLDGDNLFFTSRFLLFLHKSDKELEFTVDQRECVSSRSIQIQEASLPMPRDFMSSAESNASSNCQETEETATVHLCTHFGDFRFENVEVKHKKFFISCRKQQVANLSIAEVIELSFLGALLERHPRNAHSKRYKVIHDFLDVIIDIIPIESAFSCIANMSSDQNARHLCQALRQSKINPPLSSALFISAALAITKLRGEMIHFSDTATLEDLFYVFVVAAKKRSLPIFWSKQSLSQIVDEGRYLKWFGPEIASNCRNGDMVRYLQKIVDEAIKNNEGRIPAISGINMRSFFEAMEAKNSDESPLPARFVTLKSPKCLLKEGRRELNTLQNIAREKLKSYSNAEKELAFTKAHNAMLLDYVKKLRSEDLYMCIQVITAFMEDQVRIPISDYFNITISYWQLLKLGLGIFRRKVSKNIAQYITVGKHIRSIADVTSHAVDPYQPASTENSKYAGKLQFLLSASLRQDEPLLIDDKYLMYSLESHLYNRFTHASVPQHLRIDDKTPLEEIEQNWDVLFKDVGLSKVVHTHRRLVARWLKFSLMIHKLRAELSCHATVGIVGLVNSGKSTLVKELFKIEAIETGTREEKRTTVPFLYSIPGVENFDVIDFPGVDDQDDNISDLVNLLRTLSQLVVFVVNYRNAHTQAAVEWYRKLNQHAIPHLVCLTHGDRLYAECMSDEGRDPSYAQMAITKQVEIIREKIVSKASDSPMRCLGLYSLKVDNDSLLKSPEGQRSIREAGVSGVKDVGKWIVTSLEDHLEETITAQMLKSFFGLT